MTGGQASFWNPVKGSLFECILTFRKIGKIFKYLTEAFSITQGISLKAKLVSNISNLEKEFKDN